MSANNSPFDIIKASAVAPFIGEIENKDLLYISYEKEIPSIIRGFQIIISLNENGHVQFDSTNNQIPDPSTIYVHLPIKENYNAVRLPYWPNYIDISPEQRFTYLNWLRNVDNPIDAGYVFLYYYGLERQLLIGNFEKAFNQIIRLRNVHKNKSFQQYTEKALIHSCIMRDRLDLLLDLHEKTEISGFSNAQFLLADDLKMDLSAQNILSIFYKAFPLSRKAIKENYDLMLGCTKNTLSSKYSKEGFTIADYDISNIKTTIETRFANYSFPKEIQNVEITDFYKCKQLMTDIETIFKLSYDEYKKIIAIQRKKQKSNKSEEEIKSGFVKKGINRYKKLLSDKKITNEEFEILVDFINNKNLQS
jgi:hypothetical protein